jgi:hypothetical protein
MEISGDPGQTLIGEIELFNEQNEARTYFSSTANFEARGDTGAPHFLEERVGLATWISVQESVHLEPQERKMVPYSIVIPPGAEPGGHFAAIFWGQTPQAEAGGQVAIGGRLGMLILLSVTGEVMAGQSGLGEFGVEEGRLVNALPVTFFYRFFNDSRERVRPSGEIAIRNLFGFTVATLDANRGGGNVLPGSTRKFSVTWQERGQEKSAAAPTEAGAAAPEAPGFFAAAGNQWRNFALGPYWAELNLVYGSLIGTEADQKQTQASYLFFVIPWQLLSIIIFVLIIVGFLSIIGIKRYNRWIIRKAGGAGG